MSHAFFTVLTHRGEARLTKAIATGKKVIFTHMAVGDSHGNLTAPDAAQTNLINQRYIAPINQLLVDPNNNNQLIVELIIPAEEGGYWIREIGLFDEDNVLIAVANCPESYKPKLQEGSGRTQSIRMQLLLAATDAVTLKIDPNVVLASRRYVDDQTALLQSTVTQAAEQRLQSHINAADPHPQYLQIANALTVLKKAGLITQSKGVETVTRSGQFLVPDHVDTLWVSACAAGGGGGGGGCRTDTKQFGGGGGGGGGGQSVLKQKITVKAGEIIPITVGQAGIGGNTVTANDGKTGSHGGNTSFGSYLMLQGGQGGYGGGGDNRMNGGGPGIGYPNGSWGQDGVSTNTTISHGNSGAGASCSFGGGGGAARSAANGTQGGASGGNAAGYGAGGAGGATGITGKGGNGAPGLVIIEW